MPNIKVVTPRRSPLNEMIIDLEETVNPLSQSRTSLRSNKPVQPAGSRIIDEEDPDAGEDSDDNGPLIKVVPVD